MRLNFVPPNSNKLGDYNDINILNLFKKKKYLFVDRIAYDLCPHIHLCIFITRQF